MESSQIPKNYFSQDHLPQQQQTDDTVNIKTTDRCQQIESPFVPCQEGEDLLKSAKIYKRAQKAFLKHTRKPSTLYTKASSTDENYLKSLYDPQRYKHQTELHNKALLQKKRIRQKSSTYHGGGGKGDQQPTRVEPRVLVQEIRSATNSPKDDATSMVIERENE